MCQKEWERVPNSTFVEVTGGKLVGGTFLPPILNRVNIWVENLLLLNICDTESLVCYLLYVIQGLREEKNEVYQTENIYSSKLSWLRIWCFKEVLPSNEFKRIFCIINTIRLKGEENFFIAEILEVFYFPSAFIGMI